MSTSTSPSQPAQPQHRYTHSQPAQTAIPPPKPIEVKFEENPDVLALKSAASILQIQARNAVKDIQALQRIKERALRDPEAFSRALESGEAGTRLDPLYFPGEDTDEDGEGEGNGDVEMEGGDLKANGDEGGKMGGVKGNRKKGGEGREKWERLPTQQNVVRCPPINWNQYAVVGESLDKIHKDLLERPSEGVPQRIGADGQLVPGGEGQRREFLGVAAPYQPGRDKIEKMSTRKGGKR
jgi:hypothetical protein